MVRIEETWRNAHQACKLTHTHTHKVLKHLLRLPCTVAFTSQFLSSLPPPPPHTHAHTHKCIPALSTEPVGVLAPRGSMVRIEEGMARFSRGL